MSDGFIEDGMTFVYSSTVTPPFELGQIINAPNGDSYRFVRATDAVTLSWPVFDASASAIGNVTYDFSAASGPCRGFAQAALAAGEYGWVKRKGVQTVLGTAAIATANFRLRVVADGYVGHVTTLLENCVAWSKGIITAAGSVAAEVDCP